MSTHKWNHSVPVCFAACAVAFGVLAWAAMAAPQQSAPSAREISLTVGKSIIVNSATTIERVSVGYGDIADARAIGPTEVLLNGKAAGETTLIIWQVGGSPLFFDVSVRANSTAARNKFENLKQELQKYLPGQEIEVSVDNDTLFLQGTVKDLNTADRAVAIAGTAYPKVVNLLFAQAPVTEPQILLKVRFIRVDRTVQTDLGFNLFSSGAGNTIGSVGTGQYSSGATLPSANGGPFNIGDALNVFLLRRDLNLAATIKALESKGLAEILAEPNVLAINGKQANFLAGGEFPYPVPQAGGVGGAAVITIAFHQFGVRIDFLPLITSRGTIRLAVAPEVSSLDYTNGTSLNGATVPGLATQRVETELEVDSGQSFAIGGLLDRRLQETMDRIPGLAAIPLLGKLFQSKHWQKQNQELLVIITPEIVKPIPQTSALPSLELPVPLWGPDKMPRTPGSDVTGAEPQTAGPLIPVEQLQQNIKTQNDMRLIRAGQGGLGPGGTAPIPATPPGGGGTTEPIKK